MTNTLIAISYFLIVVTMASIIFNQYIKMDKYIKKNINEKSSIESKNDIYNAKKIFRIQILNIIISSILALLSIYVYRISLLDKELTIIILGIVFCVIIVFNLLNFISYKIIKSIQLK